LTVTAHHHELDCSEAGYFDADRPRRGPIRRVFAPVIRIGWNIASIALGGKVREARDRALWNDFEGAMAFDRKHHEAIGKMLQDMLQRPPQVD
jgi:hypothetical protein